MEDSNNKNFGILLSKIRVPCFYTSSTKDGCLLRKNRKTADMEPMSNAHMMLIDRRLPQVSHIKWGSLLNQNWCSCRAFHRGHSVTDAHMIAAM